MDDSTPSSAGKTTSRPALGISSFNARDQQQFGQKVRLAMACIEGTAEPSAGKAMPADTAAISQRLKTLSQDITSSLADLLELLVRYDELKGWESSGAKHCSAWMNYELGIKVQLGWEYLRVGKELRQLPTTTALFRVGKLSWSKVRLISRVANAENEETLCHAALDASVTEVERLCCGYRWNDDDEDKSENARAVRQHASRSLTWKENALGSIQFRLVLPPELAQVVINSIEHSLNQLDDSDSTISQRRADAAVLMAESSLQYAGQAIATADRYQVIVSVDKTTIEADNHTPPRRPTIKDAGPIARETARRIACDCSITTNTTRNGEPVDIGRKSRIWPTAMARAIKERDQHCQFPGCSQTRSQHLQIHHIKHWAEGGTTCVENGCVLCSSCHIKVHEGGYTIQRVAGDQQRLDEQFAQQVHDNDPGMFDFEKDLRSNRASFDHVRNVSPTRYRFRVVDSQGRDIRGQWNNSVKPDKTPDNAYRYHEKSAGDSTRVGCAEPTEHYVIASKQQKMRHEYRATLH